MKKIQFLLFIIFVSGVFAGFTKLKLRKNKSQNKKTRQDIDVTDLTQCKNFNDDEDKCISPCIWTKGPQCNGVQVGSNGCPSDRNQCNVCPGCLWENDKCEKKHPTDACEDPVDTKQNIHETLDANLELEEQHQDQVQQEEEFAEEEQEEAQQLEEAYAEEEEELEEEKEEETNEQEGEQEVVDEEEAIGQEEEEEEISSPDPTELMNEISQFQQLEEYISRYAKQVENVKENPKLANKVHNLFKALNLQEGDTPNPEDKFKKQAGYYAQWLDKPFRECIYPVTEANSMTFCENTFADSDHFRILLCKKYQCLNCCNNFRDIINSLRQQGEAILALNIQVSEIEEFVSESEIALCRKECEVEYQEGGRPDNNNPKPNPDDPEPNPDDPKPNPDDPNPDDPNPDDPKPNPDDPNPDDPKPNPDDPKPNPDDGTIKIPDYPKQKCGDDEGELQKEEESDDIVVQEQMDGEDPNSIPKEPEPIEITVDAVVVDE